MNINKLVLELLALSLYITQKTKYNCWFDYSGNVDYIDIYCRPKTGNTNNRAYEKTFWIAGNLCISIEDLKKIVSDLKKIANEEMNEFLSLADEVESTNNE